MTKRVRGRSGRKGFTLVEILVTLVLVALLIGVVLPAVLRQLDRGEGTRIAGDLESVRTAVQMFRVDVRRFPSTPMQLVESPDEWPEESDSTDVNGVAIPPGLLNRWNGPYLEVGELAEGDTLVIALGIQADPAFDTNTIGSANWMTLDFFNVSDTQLAEIDAIIDGDDGDDTGRVRWTGDPPVLTYYIVPIN